MTDEDAANALSRVANNWDCGHMESRLCDCARDAEQWGIAADEVRALTPADAKAALDARDRAKVAEGMRMAAELTRHDTDCCDRLGGMSKMVEELEGDWISRDAILSRAKDMEAGKAESDGLTILRYERAENISATRKSRFAPRIDQRDQPGPADDPPIIRR